MLPLQQLADEPGTQRIVADEPEGDDYDEGVRHDAFHSKLVQLLSCCDVQEVE